MLKRDKLEMIIYAIWGGDRLNNLHKQPSPNSKVEKYDSIFNVLCQQGGRTTFLGFKTLE